MALIPTQQTLTVGGRVFTDLANLITLYADTNSTNVFSTLRKMGSQSGAGYQVTSGKTLHILAARIASEGSGGSEIALAQTDNDVGPQTTTTPTNPIYFGLESSTPADVLVAGSGIGVVGEVSGAPLGVVASGKYLTSNSLGSTGGILMVFGYEV